MKTLDITIGVIYFLIFVSALITVDKLYYTKYRKISFMWCYGLLLIEVVLFSVKILLYIN